jgi:tetratricopeptide (TPR) repeat protein
MNNPEVFTKLNLDNARAVKNTRIGQNLFNEKRFEESLEFFENILEESRVSKATSYLLTGVLTFGIGAALTPLFINERFDPVYRGAAHSSYWLGYYEKSLKYFGKVVEKNSFDIYIMAWAQHNLGNKEISELLFERSMKQNGELKKYKTPYHG